MHSVSDGFKSIRTNTHSLMFIYAIASETIFAIIFSLLFLWAWKIVVVVNVDIAPSCKSSTQVLVDVGIIAAFHLLSCLMCFTNLTILGIEIKQIKEGIASRLSGFGLLMMLSELVDCLKLIIIESCSSKCRSGEIKDFINANWIIITGHLLMQLFFFILGCCMTGCTVCGISLVVRSHFSNADRNSYREIDRRDYERRDEMYDQLRENFVSETSRFSI